MRALKFVLALCAFAEGVRLMAQPAVQPRKAPVGIAVPHGLQSELLALGKGVKEKGKERLTLTGQWSEKGNARQVTVIVQLDGKCVIRDSGKTLANDGKDSRSSAGSISDDEEDLLEIFGEDSAEGLFFNTGGLLRVVATGVNVGGGTPSPGPLYNILEVRNNAFAKNSKVPRIKHFYFNSRNGDLEIVRYFTKKGNRDVVVETRRENWAQTSDRRVPGLIRRIEDGQARFSFSIASAIVGAAADDGVFAGR